MANSNPQPNQRAFFEGRLTSLAQASVHLQRRASWLSWMRVSLFVLFLIGIIYFANTRNFDLMLMSLVLFVPSFGVLIRLHNRAQFEWRQHQALMTINEEELSRIDGTLSGLDGGMEYLDVHHAYAPDLDIFGSHSLFQLIVRSKWTGTKDLISDWLLYPSDTEAIQERHAALQELISDTEWRQKMTAYSYHGSLQSKKQLHLMDLIHWMEAHFGTLDKPIWGFLRYAMPLLSSTVLIGMGTQDWAYQWIYLPVLINLGLLSMLFKPLMDITKEFGHMSQFLKGYENVIAEIENKSFESPLLSKWSQALKGKGYRASGAMRSLRRILLFLLGRANLLYQPFNVLFLLDVNWLLMAVHWKKTYIQDLESWFEAVHHIDGLSDLSSFAFAHPDFAFPIHCDEGHILKTTQMGHPLIRQPQRVVNDFELCRPGKLGLVTGSNMSGKSTFLRTIGVNMVLAQMGAPVCAATFEWSQSQIFTSMRTQDNLEENVSSFYAELQRLRQLLDLLEKEQPVFYMLDEILKGTNSDDRHNGALSLIDQLIHKNCRGLISTHDIQLSALSTQQSNLQNYSFNSTIVGDEIHFDYRLSHAPCGSFNASKLMEKMGIIKK